MLVKLMLTQLVAAHLVLGSLEGIVKLKEDPDPNSDSIESKNDFMNKRDASNEEPQTRGPAYSPTDKETIVLGKADSTERSGMNPHKNFHPGLFQQYIQPSLDQTHNMLFGAIDDKGMFRPANQLSSPSQQQQVPHPQHHVPSSSQKVNYDSQGRSHFSVSEGKIQIGESLESPANHRKPSSEHSISTSSSNGSPSHLESKSEVNKRTFHQFSPYMSNPFQLGYGMMHPLNAMPYQSMLPMHQLMGMGMGMHGGHMMGGYGMMGHMGHMGHGYGGHMGHMGYPYGMGGYGMGGYGMGMGMGHMGYGMGGYDDYHRNGQEQNSPSNQHTSHSSHPGEGHASSQMNLGGGIYSSATQQQQQLQEHIPQQSTGPVSMGRHPMMAAAFRAMNPLTFTRGPFPPFPMGRPSTVRVTSLMPPVVGGQSSMVAYPHSRPMNERESIQESRFITEESNDSMVDKPNVSPFQSYQK